MGRAGWASAPNARRWRARATTGPLSPSARSRQEQLLEVVQEVETERGRRGTLQVAVDEAAPLGLHQRLLDRRHRQAGALAKGDELEAILQAQGVEHELERQVGARDLDFARD